MSLPRDQECQSQVVSTRVRLKGNLIRMTTVISMKTRNTEKLLQKETTIVRKRRIARKIRSLEKLTP
jgi:hypothetical protein